MNKNKRVSIFVNDLAKQLLPRYKNQTMCEQYAWWMVQAITNKSKAQLIAQQTIQLNTQQQEKLREWTDKQINESMPLQYLIGFVPFAGLQILVEPPVLIPRMETEQWCTQFIEQLKTAPQDTLNILELCTGSGCIALALGNALPHAQIVATDIADNALALARKNAQHNNVNNVTFFKSDVYKALAPDKQFDVIIANPPYISKDEWKELDPSVTQWEDEQALIAQDKGLAILQRIIHGAPSFVRTDGILKKTDIPHLVVEIGHLQGAKVRDLMYAAGFTKVNIQRDWAGRDRVVSGRVMNVATTTNKKRTD